jgi:hypothetical protein
MRSDKSWIRTRSIAASASLHPGDYDKARSSAENDVQLNEILLSFVVQMDLWSLITIILRTIASKSDARIGPENSDSFCRWEWQVNTGKNVNHAPDSVLWPRFGRIFCHKIITFHLRRIVQSRISAWPWRLAFVLFLLEYDVTKSHWTGTSSGEYFEVPLHKLLHRKNRRNLHATGRCSPRGSSTIRRRHIFLTGQWRSSDGIIHYASGRFLIPDSEAVSDRSFPTS